MNSEGIMNLPEHRSQNLGIARKPTFCSIELNRAHELALVEVNPASLVVGHGLLTRCIPPRFTFLG